MSVYRIHAALAKLCIAVFTLTLLIAASGPTRAEQIRGLLVMGHEVRSLQPCGDERTLWVSVRGALRQQLEAAVHSITTRPYETVYVELDGVHGVQSVSGFAADYDGTFEVAGIRHVSQEGVDACRNELLSTAPRTYVFVCSDSLVVTVRASDTGAWLFHPEGTRRLAAVPAERGTGYTDGIFELQIEGEQAQLGASGGPLGSCRNDPRAAVWERAKLNGADFRAVGNEPGWSLEILAGRRLVLLADYGASRVELPLPEPTVDPAARRTRWDADEIILEVIGRPCRDSMSGESFETEAIVYWQGRTLRGCGRALH